MAECLRNDPSTFHNVRQCKYASGVNEHEEPSSGSYHHLLGTCECTLMNTEVDISTAEENKKPTPVVEDDLLRPTLSLSWSKDVNLGRGAFAVVYEGFLYDTKVAIKKVIKTNVNSEFNNIKEDIIKMLDHPNILKVYSVLHQIECKYFVMELCVATLQQYGKGQYTGPMPSEEDGLCQMASGLDYIHSHQLAHRNIKPSNVLISGTQSVQLKWSDFGLSKTMGECRSYSPNAPVGTYDWMAPEILKDLIECLDTDEPIPGQIVLKRGTIASDIFSAGCLFFFFLEPPLHPFGNEAFIRANITEGNPIFLGKLDKDHFAFDLISEMINYHKEERITLQSVLEKLKPLSTSNGPGSKRRSTAAKKVQQTFFRKTDLIGNGNFGPIFRDLFQSMPVAVQRVDRARCAEISYVEEIWCAIKHDNVENLWAMINDVSFRFYITELYGVSLDRLYNDEFQVFLPKIPDDEQVLHQLASGLNYLHSQDLVHSYIMPKNVLFHDSGRVKWANLFGLQSVESTMLEMLNWMAPELLAQKYQFLNNCFAYSTTCSDVFSVGCVFFFILTKGKHLFGSSADLIQSNILNPRSAPWTKLNILHMEESMFADLIKNLIKSVSQLRPSMSEVVNMLENLHSNHVREHDEVRLPIRYFSDVNLVQAPELSAYKGWNKEDPVSESLIAFPFLQFKKETVKYSTNPTPYGLRVHGYSEGFFRGERVTIMKYPNISSRDIQLLRLLNHPNVVKPYLTLSSGGIVLQPCAASLDQLFLEDGNPNKYKDLVPTDEQVLYQLASGLSYIHSIKIVHRDIRPENILISSSAKLVQMKLSNFKFAKLDGSFSYSYSHEKRPPAPESITWISPEVLTLLLDTFPEKSDDTDETDYPSLSHDCFVLCDIFSMGCVFLYYLLRGIHPFGSEDWAIPSNIINGNSVNLKELPTHRFAHHFVTQMIEKDPKKRISLSNVIRLLKPLLHPTNSMMDTRLSVMNYYGSGNLIFDGTFSCTYLVPLANGTSVVVKRVPIDISSTSSEFSMNLFNNLKTLDHPNIVRLLDYDHDNSYKYFSMQLCSVSLDQCFFPEGGGKVSSSITMPGNERFLFQLVSGLEYIHSKSLVHGSIKPSNVLLISSSTDPQVKLSDFGLTRESQTISSFKHASDCTLQHISFWLAPELLQVLLQHSSRHVTVVHCTKDSDIFAAGSVFFYFLSQGFHLFGDVRDILPNTTQGKQVNLFRKLKNHSITSGLVRLMAQKDPKDRPSLSHVLSHLKFYQPLTQLDRGRLATVGEITFSTDCLLGEGFGGLSSVFLGLPYNGRGNFSYVVKRMNGKKRTTNIERVTMANVLKKLKHENLVRLINFSNNNSSMVLALEKCLASLDAYCRQPLLYQDTIPKLEKDRVLSEMIDGLDYIHSQKLIYRDIKPENVLIYLYGCSSVIKWADFGISRAVERGKEYFTRKRQGTERWLAPELIEAMENREKETVKSITNNDFTLCCQGSVECDIFALGCVYFFFLVPGVHPFGEKDCHIRENIKIGAPVNINCLSSEYFYLKAVDRMVAKDPKSRPTIRNIKDSLRYKRPL